MSDSLQPAHWSKAPWVALGGAIVLAIGLFLLIPLTQWLQPEPQEIVSVRQVITIQPPSAEAPPPPEETPPVEETPPPEFEHAIDTLDINQLSLAIDPGVTDALEMEADMSDFTMQVDVAASIEQIFTFEDLNGAPRIVSVPRLRFPNSLSSRGIREGQVVLQVVIDEEGRVQVEKVISSTHVDLEQPAVDAAKRARFSPPELDGKRVKVRGNWPIQMQAN